MRNEGGREKVPVGKEPIRVLKWADLGSGPDGPAAVGRPLPVYSVAVGSNTTPSDGSAASGGSGNSMGSICRECDAFTM